VLEVVEVRDAAGGALDMAPSQDDPFALPPAPPATQQRGREILRRMGEANARWLKGPFRTAPELAYRFQFQVGEKEGSDVVVRPGATRHGSHQGISYSSALKVIASDPAQAVIRRLSEEGDRITIDYTLKEPYRLGTGTGVAGTWRGYFQRSTKDNTLVLDANQLTPVTHSDSEMSETYGQFHEIQPGQYVPLSVKIRGSGFDFDWRFAWYEVGVWLFARSYWKGEVDATTENVRIGGVLTEPEVVGMK
jgi:hypothetical protein